MLSPAGHNALTRCGASMCECGRGTEKERNGQHFPGASLSRFVEDRWQTRAIYGAGCHERVSFHGTNLGRGRFSRCPV